MATTITVGRNAGANPLPNRQWREFRDLVDSTVWRHGLEVYFRGVGTGQSETWGEEDAYTVICADPLDGRTWDLLLEDLGKAGHYYGQDAVAVTGRYSAGSTLFVPRR